MLSLRRWRWQRRCVVFSLCFLCLVAVTFIINPSHLSHVVNDTWIVKTPLRGDVPHPDQSKVEYAYKPSDTHPISKLIKEADRRWQRYEEDRSSNFRETVAKYRRKYGRHPPPGFRDWYVFARKRNVHNIDDFEQIMDDLRPFWALEPRTMRRMAARLQETDGISGVHIRGKKVVKVTEPGWRAQTLARFISRFIEYLPDMDIPVNSMDQPRLVVPYEDMQVLLEEEKRSRKLPPNMKDQYTEGMGELLDLNQETHDWGDDDATDPHWFFYAGGRQYMDIAKLVCPPDSPARNPEMSPADVDKLYKTQLGDFVSDFSLSTDLCIVGPKIQSQHGFLSSPASISASKRLLPVFSECKVSANNDILFPANMYMLQDERYSYDPTFDLEWGNKADTLMWRGVTSGGIQTPDTWRNLHRQRLVIMTNETEIKTQDFPILSEAAGEQYLPSTQFNASEFAQKHFDVGFTATMACIPDCEFYDGNVTLKSQVELPKQFENKFLIDVDGHSFSGRWRAFEYSKSLGIKATIFREWHDSRLFAWRHFVPLDNLYDEFYSLMTYFTGHGSPSPTHDDGHGKQEQEAYMPAHDFEGKMIAAQGRTWAQHVLRDEDLEIYTLRLFLEYARLLDDHRDYIGYDGDGSELDEFDRMHPMPDNLALFSWKELGVNSDDHLRSDFE